MITKKTGHIGSKAECPDKYSKGIFPEFIQWIGWR
jgi:hypothetical protein